MVALTLHIAMEKTQIPPDISLEVDGPGASSQTIDAPLFLELAASFFFLVKGNADASGHGLQIRGIEIFDKCLTVCSRADDHPSKVLDWVKAAGSQLTGNEEAPHGYKNYAQRGQKSLALISANAQKAVISYGDIWNRELRAEVSQPKQPNDAFLSVRARVVRVGGDQPTAIFESLLESQAFALRLESNDIAKRLATQLYEEVDIEALVVRDSDGTIQRGTLHSFECVQKVDAGQAWHEWFTSVGGDAE